MKKSIAVLLLAVSIQLNAQTYDQQLAAKYGADEYGMKSYILVLLKSGTNTTADQATVNNLFRGHMENIGKLAADGKLVVAGPMQKNDKSYRGIFILNVKTKEEANELLLTDPAIREKLLDAELYEWYGSAALPAYLETHEKIQKTKI